MAVSGRLLYLVILPVLLTVITILLFIGVRTNYFLMLTATASQKKFLSYQQNALSRVGPGEQGEAYLTSGSGVKAGDVVNLRATQDIAYDRSIKDFRHQSCKNLRYKAQLPKATVIVTFNKEERSLLLRTLHSVVNRTPPQYLSQVLLLPYGNITNVTTIEKYVTKTWEDDLVRVIPPLDLDNMYDARMTGASRSQGEVLVFLNSHCEAAEGWLEPLLKAIVENPTTVAVPVIDKIDPATLAHIPTDTDQRGGFYFNMTMAWTPLSQQEKQERLNAPFKPITSPVISGEAFAVSSSHLKNIGGFKPEMYTRGLDLEFSFRVWMCGGTIEIQPCSRVGHLAHALDDYDRLSVEREEKAMIQVAEVWMEEYRRLFYMYRKYILSTPYGGDFADEHLLKERNRCLSFAWYLDKVYAGRFLPDEDVYSWGVVRNPLTGMCLSTVQPETLKVPNTEGLVYKVKCDHSGNINQTFSYTFDKTIRQEESLCLSSDGKKGSPVTLVNCRAHNTSTEWDYNKEDCIVKHHETGLCLTSGGAETNNVTLEACADLAKTQIWTFLYYLDVS